MKLGVNGRFLGARVTGVQRFARQVVADLRDRADVTLLLPAGVEPPPEVAGWARIVHGRRAGPVWEQLELPGMARRAGVDVTLHPANAAPVRGGPHVVVLHDVTPWTHPDAFARPYRVWIRVAHGRAARRAAAVVTVSAEAAADLVRVLGVPRERVRVALQGAAPLDAPPAKDRVDDVRRRLGLPDTWFLAVGRDPRKRVDMLAGIWARPDPPEVPLVVVGRPHARVHGTQVAFGAPGVRWIGDVDDDTLRALYGGAVALLFPSRAEGFGRPPLEALACGTRALSAPCPSAALLGPAVDRVDGGPAAWRAALDGVLRETRAERAARVAQGRSAAAAFTWERATLQVLAACRAALGATAGEAP